MSNLSSGESVASIRVRLPIKCGFYTRLYGTLFEENGHCLWHLQFSLDMDGKMVRPVLL